jgi:hypothetical protein
LFEQVHAAEYGKEKPKAQNNFFPSVFESPANPFDVLTVSPHKEKGNYPLTVGKTCVILYFKGGKIYGTIYHNKL